MPQRVMPRVNSTYIGREMALASPLRTVLIAWGKKLKVVSVAAP